MIDQTTAAIIAAGAALAGILLSGIVQRLLARLDRRIEARGAARILWMRLFHARIAVGDLSAYKDWDSLITDWQAFGDAWDKHNAALARVLGTEKFLDVASAFEGLASLAQSHGFWKHHPTAVFPSAERLRGYERDIDAALLLVLKVAYTLKERLTGRATGVRAEQKRLKGAAKRLEQEVREQEA